MAKYAGSLKGYLAETQASRLVSARSLKEDPALFFALRNGANG